MSMCLEASYDILES